MIPKKIQPFFRLMQQRNDGENTLIQGNLTCCDSHEFEVSIVGHLKYGLFSGIYLHPENDKMVLEIRCKKCGKVISVFDSTCDGYESCEKISGDSVYSMPRPLACNKCKSNNYSVSIKYEYPDIQELCDLGITEIDNAFTWVWITLKCNNCCAKYRNFIDFETA